MADSQSHGHFLNPWLLHFQKLGLELKCPSCLNLYNKPMLLPCNHIFCSCCLPCSNLVGSECPLCRLPYLEQEPRQAPYIENVVNIYRSLDAVLSMQMLNSDIGKVREQTPFSARKGQIDLDPSPPMNMIINPSSFSMMGNKRVQVPNNLSVIATSEKDFKAYERNHISLVPLQSSPPTVHNKAMAVDIYQAEFSPDGCPGGVRKGAEIDTCDAGSSDNTAERCLLNKCAKRRVDDLGVEGLYECNDLSLKKQKQQTQDLVKIHESHFQPSTVPTCISSETNAKSGCSSDSTSLDLVNFICAFCQTWKTTEDTGPLQHFANGKQVFGSETSRSNVIHVHQRCIEWAPQIFFESDTVLKNLDKELARASRLKCTRCGLKGAALGCLAKTCRRTYHVPCASQIEDCRWDSDEFLMLCPSHASHKFPSEKHRKPAVKSSTTSTKEIYDEQKNLPKLDVWATSPTRAQNWVLCGSALSADEKSMMVKFANLCGATVTRTWNLDVTHVIAATDGNGACSRTLKVLMSILNGRWILSIDWIKACLKAKSSVDEEPFEIRLDNHGCRDGPKTGRLRMITNAPRLFSGMNFLFSGGFVAAYKNDIEDLITEAGGTILRSKEQLNQIQSGEGSTTLVVYNCDALMDTEDACYAVQRQAEAERVALETGGCRVIAHTWVLDSIASSSLQPYAL